MGDFQNQQLGGEQDGQQNRDPQPIVHEQPATAEVRQMISSGSPEPAQIARLLHDHPRARAEIMALIHKTLGNAFALQVSKENEQIFRAEADGGTASAPGVGIAPTKFSQKGRDELPEMLANLESSTPAGASTSATDTSSSGGNDGKLTRAREALKEIEASEAESATSGSPKPAPQSPSNAGPNAETAPNAGAPQVEAPTQASKVLKDETVIGASNEVAQNQTTSKELLGPNAEVPAAQGNPNKFTPDELRNIIDGDGSALDKKQPEAPVAAPKDKTQHRHGTDRAINSFDASREYRSVSSQQGGVTVERDSNESDKSGSDAAPAAAKKPEASWVTGARRYNRAHAGQVAEFLKATGNACVDESGEADPHKVARWQADHGVAPDGRVGEHTITAAILDFREPTAAPAAGPPKAS